MAALFFDVFLISQTACGFIKFGLGTYFSKTSEDSISTGYFIKVDHIYHLRIKFQAPYNNQIVTL
jgi:hypothetical protein